MEFLVPIHWMRFSTDHASASCCYPHNYCPIVPQTLPWFLSLLVKFSVPEFSDLYFTLVQFLIQYTNFPKKYPKHKQQRSTNHQNIQKINIISIIYSNQSLNTHLFKFSGPINALYSNVIQINTSELLFQVTTSSIKPHINQHH